MARYEVGSCEWYPTRARWSHVGTISKWHGVASRCPDSRCPLCTLQVQGTRQAIAAMGGDSWVVMWSECRVYRGEWGKSGWDQIWEDSWMPGQDVRLYSVNHRGLEGLTWWRAGLGGSLQQEVCIRHEVYGIWELIELEDESKVTTRLRFWF